MSLPSPRALLRLMAAGAIALAIALAAASCGPDKPTGSSKSATDEVSEYNRDAENKRFLDNNLDQVMREREQLGIESHDW